MLDFYLMLSIMLGVIGGINIGYTHREGTTRGIVFGIIFSVTWPIFVLTVLLMPCFDSCRRTFQQHYRQR